MPDDISSITARISEIQERIASLNAPSAAPVSQTPLSPEPGQAQTPAPTFAQALRTAQVDLPPSVHLPRLSGSTRLLDVPSHISVPPASLGPLPPMPIAPGAANVVPLSGPAAPLPQVTAASGGYTSLVEKYAAQHGLNPALVQAVIKTESDGNPRCVSRAGAMGLMQLMPDNVKEAGISDPFDPEQNIAAGAKQLSGFMTQYGGNLDLALAAYNAGPGNVHKYGGVPPFTETQNYIRRVRAAMDKG